MTKQEKIQEAYGEYKGHIDKNGWTNFIAIGFFGEKNLDSKVFKSQSLVYRPKSLQGIEANNGWIKIEKEEDLPKEKARCITGFMNDKKKFIYGYEEEKTTENLIHLWETKQITHYKIKNLEEPPIY